MLKGGDFARKTVELPRRLKRLISVCTDSLMLPLALWTAISLKIGRPESNLSDWPAFLAVICRQHPNLYPRGSLPSGDPLSRSQGHFRGGAVGGS